MNIEVSFMLQSYSNEKHSCCTCVQRVIRGKRVGTYKVFK